MLHKLKLLGTAALACCALSLPLTAKADLTIENHTAFPSTCKINNQKGNAQCSSSIPVYGVTKPNTVNVIPSGIIWGACLANLHNCVAEVYMTDNCTGPVVAKATFDYSTGMKTIDNLPNSDSFTLADRRPQNAFYLDIFGGPANITG